MALLSSAMALTPMPPWHVLNELQGHFHDTFETFGQFYPCCYLTAACAIGAEFAIHFQVSSVFHLAPSARLASQVPVAKSEPGLGVAWCCQVAHRPSRQHVG